MFLSVCHQPSSWDLWFLLTQQLNNIFYAAWSHMLGTSDNHRGDENWQMPI